MDEIEDVLKLVVGYINVIKDEIVVICDVV